MCDPATAILGSGAVSGIGSLIGGGISASASNAAARTQAAAANNAANLQFQAEQNALQVQQQQFGVTQANLAPYLAEGAGGLNFLNSDLSNLLAPAPVSAYNLPSLISGIVDYAGQPPPTLSTPTFNPPTNMQQLARTPGYQFALQQGLMATQNSQAAQGLATSGSALKSAATFAQGLASTTYQNQYNNALNAYNSQFQNAVNAYNSQYQNLLGAGSLTGQMAQAQNQQSMQFGQLYLGQEQQQYNMLANLANIGLGAATGQAQYGQQAAQNIGNINLGAASAIGQNITSGAAAQAAGLVGSANAVGNALSGAGSAGSNTALLLALNNAGMFGANAGAAAGNQDFSG